MSLRSPATVGEKQSCPMKVNWKTSWFPILTGAIIAGAFVLSALERGFYTWPFNSVVFIPPAWGAAFTAACLGILVLSLIYRDRPERLRPGKAVRGLSYALFLAFFLVLIVSAAPLVPNLYGDGGFLLVYERFPRLRTDLVRLVSGWLEPWILGRPYFRFLPLEFTMPFVSLGFGTLYIFTSLMLVVKALPSFRDRLSGLAFFAFFPFVVNFTGHWDSYSILVTLLTAFLAFAFLAAEKNSTLMAIAAGAAFLPAVWEKQLAAAALLYPLAWLIFRSLKKRRAGRKLRILVPLAALCLLSAAGLAVIIQGLPFSQLGHRVRAATFGQWFRAGLAEQGLVRTLYTPANTVLPVVLPLFVLIAAAVFSRSFRRKLAESPTALSAFWGALVLAAGYYAMQLLNPIAAYGTLDFLVHSGTLGSLIAVPVFAVIVKTRREWLPALAVLSLFLTIPRLFLQSRPDHFSQLINVLTDERWVTDGSIYDHAASRPLVVPGPALKEYACRMFIAEVPPELGERASAPLKDFFRIVEKYAYAREREGNDLLWDYLSSRPNAFKFLLAVKPHWSGRIMTARFFSDTRSAAKDMFDATGDETYLSIARLADYGRERLFVSGDRELAAVLIRLDYLRHPGTPLPPDGVSELAEEAIEWVETSISGQKNDGR